MLNCRQQREPVRVCVRVWWLVLQCFDVGVHGHGEFACAKLMPILLVTMRLYGTVMLFTVYERAHARLNHE